MKKFIKIDGKKDEGTYSRLKVMCESESHSLLLFNRCKSPNEKHWNNGGSMSMPLTTCAMLIPILEMQMMDDFYITHIGRLLLSHSEKASDCLQKTQISFSTLINGFEKRRLETVPLRRGEHRGDIADESAVIRLRTFNFHRNENTLEASFRRGGIRRHPAWKGCQGYGEVDRRLHIGPLSPFCELKEKFWWQISMLAK
jgi:hypothetical protein